MYYHRTISKYVGALLDLFNDLKVQVKDSKGNLIEKNIPVVYARRDKEIISRMLSTEGMTSGNTNILPRAFLSLDVVQRDQTRQTNKSTKINVRKNIDSMDFQYNSIAMRFTFTLSVVCRGMNEASMILEQIIPMFNPYVALDINDADNLNEPTRCIITCPDCTFEADDYDEFSQNLVTVIATIELLGNIYQPIKDYSKIKEFIANGYFNEDKFIMNWDVVDTIPVEKTYTMTDKERSRQKLKITDIVNVTECGHQVNFEQIIKNKKQIFKVQYDISPHVEYNIEMRDLLDTADIVKISDNEFEIRSDGDVILEAKIRDEYENEYSMTKEFSLFHPRLDEINEAL